jgi:hypothetical protein
MRLTPACSPAGERYDEAGMAAVDIQGPIT